MGYTIKLYRQDRIINLKTLGIVTETDLQNQLCGIKRIGIKNNYYKVLVDTTNELEIPSKEIFGKFMANLLGYFIYATYSVPEQKINEILKHGESIALKNGLIAKHFESREEALTWLKCLG